MSRAKVVQEKIVENDTPFLALFLETKNASLILLSENEDQLGTLAVALPQAPKMIGLPLSSILLGEHPEHLFVPFETYQELKRLLT